MSTVVVKQGSANRVFTDNLTATDPDTGVIGPADITGADVVTFLLRDEEGVPFLSSTAVTVVDDNPARVQWTSGLSDFTVPGVYLQMWEVHYPSGAVEFYPDEGFNAVIVEANIVAGLPPLGPSTSPCVPWITWADVIAACPDAPDISVSEQSVFTEIATEVMWGMSCKKYGVCQITARPIPQCSHSMGGAMFGSPGWGGWSYGLSYAGGSLAGSWAPCGCGAYSFVHLGEKPIAEIVSVTIDGVELSSANYRVDEWNFLVRTDGLPWPCCDFVVTWRYGSAPSVTAKRMAALLACQYAKQNAGGVCDLPAGTDTISREGVTINITDPEKLAKMGRTGIGMVDQWLSVVCPDGQKSGGHIVDPGARAHEWYRQNTAVLPAP